MASGKTTKTTTPVSNPSTTAPDKSADTATSKTLYTGAVSPLDIIRTNNDLTRKRGGSRGSIDTQDPGYVNDQLNRVLYALDAFKKGDVSVSAS